MKLINKILTLAFCLTVILLCGCSKEEDNVARAVLSSTNSLNFPAQEPVEKLITVYSDAEWFMEELPEWITVTPTTGSGTTEVTISVSENMRDGSIDNPRNATVVFRGSTLASRAEVQVFQDGDKYRDCKEYSVSDLMSLKDGTVVIVPSAYVSAVTSAGCMITDADAANNIYIETSENVKIGDEVYVMGTKESDTYKLSDIICDNVTVLSEDNDINYVQPNDITDKIDSFTSDKRDYVTLRGVLLNNVITIDGAVNSVSLVDVPGEYDLNSLNGHYVIVKGYYAGTAAPTVRIILESVIDDGVSEVIFFSEDFEWLKPWAENSGAGQTVENDGSGSAPQIYSAKNSDGQTASDALLARGYGLEQIPGNAIYLQNCYLKFGKTDYQAGLTLPSIDNIPENSKLKLSFDWAPMVGGTRKFDPVNIIVSITNGSNVTEMEPIGHNFVDTVDKLEWLHAEIFIDGVEITKDTRISIKSDGWGDTAETTGSSVYKRWFIDNIKLVQVK